MGFFDFKLLIIMFLTLAVYILYHEINNINKKLKLIDNKYNNNNNKKNKNNNNNNNDKDSNLFEQLKEQFTLLKKENNICGLDSDKCELDSVNPDNLEFIQKNLEIIQKEQDLFNNFNILEHIKEKFREPVIVEIYTHEDFNNKNNDKIYEIRDSEIHETKETQVYEIHDLETHDSELQKSIVYKIEDIDNDTKNIDDKDNENYDNINFENVCEVYSNEDKNKIEIINIKKSDEEPPITNIKKIENIIKNINKYKLPELQDFALEFNISLYLNNKKKTKQEIIDDLKSIINKNI
jgi:hypothetical protein